jgi:elongator complex protein 1
VFVIFTQSIIVNTHRNEDVSETMYKETLKAKDLVTKSKMSQEQIDTKVNRICDAFLAVLEQPQYRDEHLQNIITAHCSKVPPALETGLDMIGRLQGKYIWFGPCIHNANCDDSFQRSLD